MLKTLTRSAATAYFVLALASPGFAQAPVPAPDPVAAKATALIQRFETAVRACGVNPGAMPGIVIDSQSTLVAFDPRERNLHLSRWAEMPPPIQGLVTEWAAKGTLGLSPEDQFAEIFNSLLIPHELGHFVQMLDGRDKTLDDWTAEVDANRVTIAFWSLEPADAAQIAARVENFNAFLAALPSPVPEGEDPHAYFEANYQRLSQDPAAYGWYQGAFMRSAWAQRNDATFCQLVKPDIVETS